MASCSISSSSLSDLELHVKALEARRASLQRTLDLQTKLIFLLSSPPAPLSSVQQQDTSTDGAPSASATLSNTTLPTATPPLPSTTTSTATLRPSSPPSPPSPSTIAARGAASSDAKLLFAENLLAEGEGCLQRKDYKGAAKKFRSVFLYVTGLIRYAPGVEVVAGMNHLNAEQEVKCNEIKTAAYQGLVDAFMNRGNFNEVVAICTKFHGANLGAKGNFSALLLQSRAHAQLGNGRAARACLNQCFLLIPSPEDPRNKIVNAELKSLLDRGL